MAKIICRMEDLIRCLHETGKISLCSSEVDEFEKTCDSRRPFTFDAMSSEAMREALGKRTMENQKKGVRLKRKLFTIFCGHQEECNVLDIPPCTACTEYWSITSDSSYTLESPIELDIPKETPTQMSFKTVAMVNREVLILEKLWDTAKEEMEEDLRNVAITLEDRLGSKLHLLVRVLQRVSTDDLSTYSVDALYSKVMKPAIEHILRVVKFRYDYQVDLILRAFPLDQMLEINKHWPGCNFAYSPGGILLQYFSLRYTDVAGLLSAGGEDAAVKFYLSWMEAGSWYLRRSFEYQLELGTIKPGERPLGSIEIFDLAGCSITQLSPSSILALKRMLKMGQEYYVSSTSAVYILNANRMFNILWNSLSKILSPKTLSKVKLYTHGASDRMKELFTPEKYADLIACHTGKKRKCCSNCLRLCGYNDVVLDPWSKEMVPRHEQIDGEIDRSKAVDWFIRSSANHTSFNLS